MVLFTGACCSKSEKIIFSLRHCQTWPSPKTDNVRLLFDTSEGAAGFVFTCSLSFLSQHTLHFNSLPACLYVSCTRCLCLCYGPILRLKAPNDRRKNIQMKDFKYCFVQALSLRIQRLEGRYCRY